MRFMAMIKSKELSGPPPQALQNAIAAATVEAISSGQLVDTGGLAPAALGARIRIQNGELTVLDGPYSEAKEVIGGFAMLEFPTREAAIESVREFMKLHQQHWPGWEGEAEVRQVFGPEGGCPGNPRSTN